MDGAGATGGVLGFGAGFDAGFGAGFDAGFGAGFGAGLGAGVGVVRRAVGVGVAVLGSAVGEPVAVGTAVVGTTVVLPMLDSGAGGWAVDAWTGVHAATNTTPAAATAIRAPPVDRSRAARSPARTCLMNTTAFVSILAAQDRTADPPNGSGGTVRVCVGGRSGID